MKHKQITEVFKAGFSIGAGWCEKGPDEEACLGPSMMVPAHCQVMAEWHRHSPVAHGPGRQSRVACPLTCLLGHVSLAVPGPSPRRRGRGWRSARPCCHHPLANADGGCSEQQGASLSSTAPRAAARGAGGRGRGEWPICPTTSLFQRCAGGWGQLPGLHANLCHHHPELPTPTHPQ